MTDDRPRRMSFRQARRSILAALSKAEAPFPVDETRFAAAPAKLIRRLPAWIGRYGWVESEGAYFLWCEPVEATEKPFPSQMVLDLKAGRYFVDALDFEAGAWIYRESCAGGPLVAGLPFTGGPVLVLVRPHPNHSTRT